MSGGKMHPIRLECGQTAKLFVTAGEGAEFEYVRIGTEVNGEYEHEIVVRLRLKCLHPDHKASMTDRQVDQQLIERQRAANLRMATNGQ